MKKNIVTLVLVAVLAMCVFLQACSSKEAPELDETTVSSGEDSTIVSGDIEVAELTHVDEVTINGVTYKKKDNVTNILLLGIDSDSDRVKQKMGWRSDMVMLCTIDNDTKEIILTSIPRDTYTKVYHVDENGKATSEVMEKLNHAYAYGGGPNSYSAQNAIQCTMEFLSCGEQISVPIDYYISIDLDGLPQLTEALGGVTVTLDQSVTDVGGKGDTVTLKGSTARKFLENRHDMSEGEMTRQYHEQIFIQSMLEDIKGMGARDVAEDLYETFIKFVRTDLTLNEVLDLASVLDGSNLDTLTMQRMQEGDGHYEGAVWYYFANEDEVLRMMLEAQYTPV
ncbi:LCP family protein [Christensenellaceae bacterium OttesenSCG-928-K19]|nr:LCP family protein [Christensenellaceae bacterium OttesenSCG-928-K19]